MKFLIFGSDLNSVNLNELLIPLRKGEKHAFEEIYSDFFGVMYHLSLQYLRDETVAEEIVQDTFMKLWEVRETISEEFHIRNFLYTITKNNCLNYLRNQKTALKHQASIKYLEMHFNYEALEKVGSYIEFEELLAKMQQVIAALPDDLRETFLLSRIDELPYKEIAEKQSLSVKAVEARMTKALKILRRELKDYLTLICLITNLFS